MAWYHWSTWSKGEPRPGRYTWTSWTEGRDWWRLYYDMMPKTQMLQHFMCSSSMSCLLINFVVYIRCLDVTTVAMMTTHQLQKYDSYTLYTFQFHSKGPGANKAKMVNQVCMHRSCWPCAFILETLLPYLLQLLLLLCVCVLYVSIPRPGWRAWFSRLSCDRTPWTRRRQGPAGASGAQRTTWAGCRRNMYSRAKRRHWFPRLPWSSRWEGFQGLEGSKTTLYQI